MYQKIIDYHNKLASKICIPVTFDVTLPALASKFRMSERDIMILVSETNYIESEWQSVYLYTDHGGEYGKLLICSSTQIEIYGRKKPEKHTFAQFKKFIKDGILTIEQY